MQKRGQIFVISGPSGTGKTTIIRAIRESVSEIGYSISHTTREPRDGEIQGKHYYFVTGRDFERMVGEGRFVEWAYVYGHLYGTSYSSLENAMQSGEDLLVDLDIRGAEAIKGHFPESLSVFILPPSMEDLEARLRARATSDREDVDLRLKKAAEEVKSCREYDFIVVNDDLAHTVHEIEAIILAERAHTRRRYPLIRDLYHLS